MVEAERNSTAEKKDCIEFGLECANVAITLTATGIRCMEEEGLVFAQNGTITPFLGDGQWNTGTIQKLQEENVRSTV